MVDYTGEGTWRLVRVGGDGVVMWRRRGRKRGKRKIGRGAGKKESEPKIMMREEKRRRNEEKEGDEEKEEDIRNKTR